MRTQEIRALLHARPFVPFAIHLADGRQMEVKHPDFVALAPTGDTIVVFQEDNSFNVVDLALATDAEVRARKVSGRTRR